MPTAPPAGTLISTLPFQRFDAWRVCHELAVATYRASRQWPPSESFGLTAQTRRAAFSAAANIAEGSAKRGSKEFRRYLDMTLGSLSELSYVLKLAQELGILSPQEWEELDRLRDRAGKLTWGLYRRVASA